MCGRFTLRTPLERVAEVFDLTCWESELARRVPPRFNVAPTQQVAAVRATPDRAGRELAWLQWGLVPSWTDDPSCGSRMINARSESLAVKPAFRDAFRTSRCLVLADGFYEWKKGQRGQQPHFIQRRDREPFAFAGLWQHWHRNGLTIDSCTIITTEANELLGHLHDRMPVILDRSQFSLWLDPKCEDIERLSKLLTAHPAELLECYPVSNIVNSPQADAPDCIVAAVPGKTQGTLFD